VAERHHALCQPVFSLTRAPCAAAAAAAVTFALRRSRLGCQVIATKELDGLRVKIPSATRNFYVGGEQQQLEQK
jgi:hypothetical protein